jgi:hypothetical protein
MMLTSPITSPRHHPFHSFCLRPPPPPPPTASHSYPAAKVAEHPFFQGVPFIDIMAGNLAPAPPPFITSSASPRGSPDIEWRAFERSAEAKATQVLENSTRIQSATVSVDEDFRTTSGRTWSAFERSAEPEAKTEETQEETQEETREHAMVASSTVAVKPGPKADASCRATVSKRCDDDLVCEASLDQTKGEASAVARTSSSKSVLHAASPARGTHRSILPSVTTSLVSSLVEPTRRGSPPVQIEQTRQRTVVSNLSTSPTSSTMSSSASPICRRRSLSLSPIVVGNGHLESPRSPRSPLTPRSILSPRLRTNLYF